MYWVPHGVTFKVKLAIIQTRVHHIPHTCGMHMSLEIY